MRRIIMMFLMLTLLGAAIFVLSNNQKLGQWLGFSSVRYVVAVKDIPAYTSFTRDQLDMIDPKPGQKIPDNAILDASGNKDSFLNTLVQRSVASASTIKKGDAIRLDQAVPFVMLQANRGSFVLVARSRIEAGQKIDPSNLRTIFMEAHSAPRGAISVNSAVSAQAAFSQALPANVWTTQAIDPDQALVVQELTYTNPGSGPQAFVDVDEPNPNMPRNELVDKLLSMPGVVVFGDNEVQNIGGISGSIDVFVSPSRAAMKNERIETHRRLLKNVHLYSFLTTDPATKDQPTLFWIRIDPASAKDLKHRHDAGALITPVPSGSPLPALQGASVVCSNVDTCYRSLTVDDSQDSAADISLPPVPGSTGSQTIPPANGSNQKGNQTNMSRISPHQP